MVSVVVATHGMLAQELLNSAAMLVGEGRGMKSVGLFPGQSADAFYEECEKVVQELDTGYCVLALVDIPNGTPNNTMFRLSKRYNLRIVTGVNLPMVMLSVLEREEGMPMDALICNLVENGKDAIIEFGLRTEGKGENVL